MATEHEIIDIVATAFNVEATTLTLASSRDDVEEWDSMGMLMLMAELDEHYELVLDEEVLAEFQTVQDIVTTVTQRVQASV